MNWKQVAVGPHEEGLFAASKALFQHQGPKGMVGGVVALAHEDQDSQTKGEKVETGLVFLFERQHRNRSYDAEQKNNVEQGVRIVRED